MAGVITQGGSITSVLPFLSNAAVRDISPSRLRLLFGLSELYAGQTWNEVSAWRRFDSSERERLERDIGTRARTMLARKRQLRPHAAVRRLVERNRAAVQLREIANDREAEPGTWRSLVGSHATLQDDFPLRRVEP